EHETDDITRAARFVWLALLDPIQLAPVHRRRIANRIATQEAEVSARVHMPAGQQLDGSRQRLAALLDRHDLRLPAIELDRQEPRGHPIAAHVERDHTHTVPGWCGEQASPAGAA